MSLSVATISLFGGYIAFVLLLCCGAMFFLPFLSTCRRERRLVTEVPTAVHDLQQVVDVLDPDEPDHDEPDASPRQRVV